MLQQLYPQERELTALEVAEELEFRSTADDRPHVVANMIMSVDGRATLEGRSGPLSSPVDRELFHALRTRADAVLIGAETLRVERYGPITKSAELGAARERARVQAVVPLCVVTNTLELPFDAPIFTDPDSEVIIFSSQSGDIPPCAAKVTLTTTQNTADNLVDLRQAMATLREEHGIGSLLCEGGPMLLGELLAQRLLDELFLSVTPKIVEGEALSLATGRVEEDLELELVSVLTAESSLYLRYKT